MSNAGFNVNVPDLTIEHCNKFNLCAGCSLIGGCSAPVSDRNFSDWVALMNKRIAALYADEIRLESNQ